MTSAESEQLKRRQAGDKGLTDFYQPIQQTLHPIITKETPNPVRPSPMLLHRLSLTSSKKHWHSTPRTHSSHAYHEVHITRYFTPLAPFLWSYLFNKFVRFLESNNFLFIEPMPWTLNVWWPQPLMTGKTYLIYVPHKVLHTRFYSYYLMMCGLLLLLEGDNCVQVCR